MQQVAVIIDKNHHPVLVTLVQCGEQLAAGFPGAINNHFFRERAQFRLVVGTHHEAGAPDAQQGEGEVDERHRTGHARLAEKHRRAQDHGRIAHRGQHRPDRLLPHETNDCPIQAQAQENHGTEHHGEGRAGVLYRAEVKMGVAVADGHGEPHGGRHEHHVEAKQTGLLDVARQLEQFFKGVANLRSGR
jgi:hypothetical protein